MLFSAFLILCITAVFTVIHYKNKFYYVFGIYAVSVSLFILTSSMYMAKIATYPYSFELDYSIFLMLSKVRISFMTLYRLYLISLCTFMVTPIFFYKLLKRSSRWEFFVFPIPIIIFMLINDPELAWSMYIAQNTLEGFRLNMLNLFLAFQKIYNNAVLVFCIILPLILLIRYFFNSMLTMKRRSALIFIICLSLIDIFVYHLFFDGYFYSINFNNVDLTKFPAEEITRHGYFMTSVLSISIVLIIFALLTIYRPFNNFSILKKSDLARNARMLNNNLNIILHTYKNAFLGINKIAMLSLKSLEASDTEKLKSSLDMLMEISNNQLKIIHRSLNYLKDVSLHTKVIDILDCISSARAAYILGDEIQFSINNTAASTLILGDYDHLKEVFVNLFQNSMNALKNLEHKGVICVSLFSEEEFLIIDFTDNGIGISKEQIKNIFSSFYTTKAAIESGGLGLTYIEKVIKMHHGDIEVNSKVNEGTTVRIVLPLICERKKK